MGEEDIRQYLSRQSGAAKKPAPVKMRVRRNARTASPEAQETFKDFSASHLLCPRCRKAMPVREKILLFLPSGNLYDYVCTACGSSCGTRKG